MDKQYHREYYKRNKERLNAANKRYYEEHKDEQNAKMRGYYRQNKDRIDAQNKDWARNHREESNAIKRRWLEKNRERFYKDINHPHRGIWERHFGVAIPKGFDIHHKDGNRENNKPDNLLCISHEEHAKLHQLK